MNGILFTLVLVVFVLTVLFKLGPIYMNYFTLKSIMTSIAEAPEPTVGGKAAIAKVLASRMMVNNVRDFDPAAFEIKKSGDNTFDLTLDYEQREHLFFNIDVVLTFNHSVVVQGK